MDVCRIYRTKAARGAISGYTRHMTTSPPRILIADDDPVGRQIAQHLLEYAGYLVDAVGDGRTALHALSQRRYVLLLLDLKLPDMDGFSVAAAVVEGMWTEQRPWLVAVSALVGEGDEARYRTGGFDACLSKPLRRTSLIACVEAGIAQRPHLL